MRLKVTVSSPAPEVDVDRSRMQGGVGDAQEEMMGTESTRAAARAGRSIVCARHSSVRRCTSLGHEERSVTSSGYGGGGDLDRRTSIAIVGTDSRFSEPAAQAQAWRATHCGSGVLWASRARGRQRRCTERWRHRRPRRAEGDGGI